MKGKEHKPEKVEKTGQKGIKLATGTNEWCSNPLGLSEEPYEICQNSLPE